MTNPPAGGFVVLETMALGNIKCHYLHILCKNDYILNLFHYLCI